jgi:hypothetical protein
MPTQLSPEEEWYKMLTEGEPVPRRLYHLHGLLPSDPRCKLCGSPFKGWGGISHAPDGQGSIQIQPSFLR